MSQSKDNSNVADLAGLHAVDDINSSAKSRVAEVLDAAKGGPILDQLNHNMAGITLDSAQDSGWETIARRAKNRSLLNANAKPWVPSTMAPNSWGPPGVIPTKGSGNTGGGKNLENHRVQAVDSHASADKVNPKPQQTSKGPEPQPSVASTVTPNALGPSGVIPTKGGGNTGGGKNLENYRVQAVDSRAPADKVKPKPHQASKGSEAAHVLQPRVIPPPLEHGWQWANRGCSGGIQPKSEEQRADIKPDDASDDDDDIDDLSDDSDSDASEKSIETRKKNKWLKKFFEVLDDLKEEQINDPERQWHCPACHDGPGAIDWYRGLQPLMTHAKTRGTRRVKLHRELAALLEEELRRRGTAVVPAGEIFGKWKGLQDTTADHEIIWPPMVVIMNTILEKDDNDKWIGMGNQELVDYFSNYAAMRARHSYGPSGHRGMSVLIFESSAMGYLEAERLHKQFADEGRDRVGWERRRVLFYPGGKRQLYGYLASKEDMDVFNQHCAGKSRLKYKVASYQEMVVIPMRKMSEDNQKLLWYKQKAVKQEQRCKTIEGGFGLLSQKLLETVEEGRIVRERTKMQCQEHKEELDYQDRFIEEKMDRLFKKRVGIYKDTEEKDREGIYKDAEEKEQNFEMLFQQEHAKARQSETCFETNEGHKHRREETGNFISRQVKGVEEFEARTEKLIHTHEQKKDNLKRKQQEEEAKLEKEFHTALTELMKEFTIQVSRCA